MTDRIDHAAEATALLENYAPDYTVAMVHATLALVEQQRIANLIALAEHAQRRYGNYAGEAGGMGTLFSYGDTPESNIRIRVDIREALAL